MFRRSNPFIPELILFPRGRTPLLDPAPAVGNLFEVDRILKKQIRHGKTEYLLGFKGYPDSHNEWQVFQPHDAVL